MAELAENGPHWDVATALVNLRALLAYPQAVDALVHHLDHMNGESRTAIEDAADALFVTLRAVVDDTVAGAEIPRTDGGRPVHRTPNCDLCASSTR